MHLTTEEKLIYQKHVTVLAHLAEHTTIKWNLSRLTVRTWHTIASFLFVPLYKHRTIIMLSFCMDGRKIQSNYHLGLSSPSTRFRVFSRQFSRFHSCEQFLFFCWPTYRSDFHARWLGQRGLTQGSNLFGNRNSKLISNSWKIQPESKIGPKNGLRNFRPKTLLYKNFTYKGPLIVIVGP